MVKAGNGWRPSHIYAFGHVCDDDGQCAAATRRMHSSMPATAMKNVVKYVASVLITLIMIVLRQ